MDKQIKIAIGVLFLALFLVSMISMASALVINSVSMNPDEIAPGETSEIKIELDNNGEEDIEDISVLLDLFSVPFAPFDSSSEFGIDEIKDGRVNYANFEIIALNDAKSGIYKIPLKITYFENNILKTKDSLIGITVNSKPIIGVSFENSLLLKGVENNVPIKIVNKGLSDVKFVEVEIKSSTYYSILSSSKVYIGDIDSDDFDNADFDIHFNSNVPTNINLPVSIVYKDATNKEYKEEIDISLKVYSREKAIELGLIEKSNTTTYVIIAVVLIVVYIIYRRIKKRRRMKLNNSS